MGATDESGEMPGWNNRHPETLSGTSMTTPYVSETVTLIQAIRIEMSLIPLSQEHLMIGELILSGCTSFYS